MHNKYFVTYYQAKQLKELGFNRRCLAFYTKCNNLGIEHCVWDESKIILENYNDDYISEMYNVQCSAPTLAEAQQWLREVKDINVYVVPVTLNEYQYWLQFERKGYGGNEDYGTENTYEKALSQGINEAIKFIRLERIKNKSPFV